MIFQDTIVALATPSGIGAISVIRLSGANAVTICTSCFEPAGNKDLAQQKSHTIHLGYIKDGECVIDEVLVSIFKAPNSYTGENVVEISCHGSVYIQQEIIQLFLRKECRMADPGEFTLRAFLNGKLDLSQAEAVADLIASDSEAAHKVAMQHMRGGFSNEIETLRGELLHFASLIELELDFAEEDVEFADRTEFEKLLTRIKKTVQRLIDSFAVGNVIKNGIPVAIAGEPNVGKSTLLNALLNEERAIVSEIAGTTRDTIEDEIHIGGIHFRFIDTAGIRNTEDTVERMGIERTFEKMEQAQVVLYLFDISAFRHSELDSEAADYENEMLKRSRKLSGQHDIIKIVTAIENVRRKFPARPMIILGNKTDMLTEAERTDLEMQLSAVAIPEEEILLLSAKEKQGVETLKNRLLSYVNTGALQNNETIVTNARHYDVLRNVLGAIQHIQEGLDAQLSGDLLAIDIRQALHYLGEITGQVTTDDILGNIFANFCIGK